MQYMYKAPQFTECRNSQLGHKQNIVSPREEEKYGLRQYGKQKRTFFSADTEELKKGCRENDKEMKCLICGETYEKGEIFHFEGRYFDAGKG